MPSGGNRTHVKRLVAVTCRDCGLRFSYLKSTGMLRMRCDECALVAQRAQVRTYYSRERHVVLERAARRWRRQNPQRRTTTCAQCSAEVVYTVTRGKVLPRFCASCVLLRKREAKRRWKKRNPDRVADMSLLRAARKRGQADKAILINRLRVWQRDEGICHICGEAADSKNFHIDHVIPLARGGAHVYENVRVAHPKCNFRKNVRLIEEMIV